MRSIALFLLFPLAVAAQVTPTLITTLSDTVNETSGLLLIGDALWTHEDSDCAPKLYQVDRNNGELLRTVEVNAANVDWEDITSDGSYVYIGDVGNNGGNRTDLRILRFPIAELEDPSMTQVDVETIDYSYEDQTSFEFAMNNNNWDCEAILAHSDSIFLFTKNWVDHRTRLYSMPAVPGVQVARFRGEADVQGLVTGVAWEASGSRIALVGYSAAPFVPFVCVLDDFNGTEFLSGSLTLESTTLAFVQVEAVEWDPLGGIIFSNEQSPFSQQRLWSLPINVAVDRPDLDDGSYIHPNPASDLLHVPIEDRDAQLSILDVTGREMMHLSGNTGRPIDISALATGNYRLILRSAGAVRNASFVISR